MQFLSKLIPKTLRHPPSILIFHWVLAGSFFMLFFSGQKIVRPKRVPPTQMRWIRLSHFSAQYLFFSCILWRIYNGVVTGNYREILPEKKTAQAFPAMSRFEFFLQKKEPRYRKYHPLQKLLYTFWLFLFLFQSITGFILYIPRRLSRLEGAFGGLGRVRRLHHMASMVSISTVIGHIYLSLTTGTEKLKSIFTGYKPWGKK